jgi:general secretion pathway protein A
MYLTYYGLKKEPFHITPDPEFLYMSKSHREALASIIYGIEQKKGFVAITGAVGVGKTTILRSYLEGAKKDLLKIVYIFNSRLTFQELLSTICKELGLVVAPPVVTEMINGLYELLIEEYKSGKTVVLVVDEAQNMPVETLESLRMISNLETSTDKLLQIVMVGQPEFDEILGTDKLRQLKQRVAVHSTIMPFNRDEGVEYMRFRLMKAGADPSSVFTKSAFTKIAKESLGIPRVINIWCDNSLISGFGYARKPVGTKIVREVIRDFGRRSKSSYTRRRHRQLVSVVGAILVAAALGIAGYIERDSLSGFMRRTDVTAPTTSLNLPSRKEQLPRQAEVPAPKPVVRSAGSGPGQLVKTITHGDTLLRLVREVYDLKEGDPRTKGLVDAVRAKNPQITDTNRILAGQKITFPDAEAISPDSMKHDVSRTKGQAPSR